MLARINRELDADFDLDAFRHRVRWEPSERRVEMHLLSLYQQTVAIPGAACSVLLAEGETIWTESSYKYRLEDVDAMARRSGFRLEAQWVDAEWPFAQSLLIAD